MQELMLKIENVSKKYKLGQIGGTTLRDELQRKRAKRKGLEDPTVTIGQKKVNVGEEFYALSNITFEVKKGERIGIIGHNGAGKSTLLKLISRVTAPTEGSIYMNGRVASMLEVGTGFHGELTGRENIYMNGAILGMSKKEIDSKIEDIIEFSECRDFIDTPVKRYSSGMYVKLAFSVAAHLDSEIMIMDEVLAVGDMAFQKKCLDKMNDVSRQNGRTILYVSHNMNTIRQLCDRVIVLKHGVIVFDGDVEEGISVYIGKDSSNYSMKYDFRNIKQPNHVTKLAKIYDLEIIGRESPYLTYGDVLEFVVNWSTSLCDRKLHFRILPTSANGVAAGTAISASLKYLPNKTNTHTLCWDTSMLAPGHYKFQIIICEINQVGSQILHECVLNAAKFQIFPKEGTLQNLEWLESWGCTTYPEIIVKEK